MFNAKSTAALSGFLSVAAIATGASSAFATEGHGDTYNTDNRRADSSTCFGPSGASVMDKVSNHMALTADEQAIASQCQSQWQQMQQDQEQQQAQEQQQKAEAEAKAYSGSNSAVQSAIRGGDQELAAELVSNHLQSIGFSPDVSNQVATSVVTQLAQTQDNDQTQGDDGINLDQSDHSNRRSVTFGSQQSVQLVAPPVGNYTCALRVGEANSNTSAPAAARSRVTNIGVAGDVGNGGGAGQVTLGLGSSSIDGINQDQGIALLTPCAEAQQTLTGVLRSVVSVDQLIVRPVGDSTYINNSLGQQQGQLQLQGGTTGRQNTPVRARQ